MAARAVSALLAVAAALTALAASAPAARDDDERNRDPRVLVVPDSKRARKALERDGARVLARYPEFTLVEASGDAVGRLKDVGAEVRDDMRRVRLLPDTIDPAVDRRGGVPDSDARTLAVVQFVGPIKDEWLSRLRRDGIRPVSYMAQNAYLVSGRGRDLAGLQEEIGKDGKQPAEQKAGKRRRPRKAAA